MGKINLDFIDESLMSITTNLIDENYFLDKELSSQFIENGVILPSKFLPDDNLGGGLDKPDGTHESFIDADDYTYDYDENELQTSNQTVVCLGLFHHKWGHCIIDNLKKIWFLFTDEYRELEEKEAITIVYTPYENFVLDGNFKEMLAKMGLDTSRWLPVTKPTKFAEIYLPDNSILLKEKDFYFYTKEYKSVLDRVMLNNIPKSYDKVYFSRTQFSDADFGEKDIETFFKKQGYKIFYPEKLSFQEQLNILSGCKCFAATEGSISHNALFLKEGSSLVVIRKADFVNGYQLVVNQVRDLNVIYIDAHLSIFNHKKPWEGPFFMYVNENLQRFSNSKRYLNSFSEKKFFQYAKKAFLDIEPKKEMDSYYWEKLKYELLNQKRHKYRKLANRFFPNIFPYKGNW